MEIYKFCYIDKRIKHPNKLLIKLENKKAVIPFYIVCFVDGSDKLEIYSSINFYQSYFKDTNIEIVGILKSEEDALEYVRRLTEISFNRFNELNFRKCIDSLNDGDI